jgi:hypothetical protein
MILKLDGQYIGPIYKIGKEWTNDILPIKLGAANLNGEVKYGGKRLRMVAEFR